ELLARSARDAQHDPLTGLLNRATLMARGGTAIQLVPHARPVALLLVNIDHFREINDNLGHAAGDEVLRVAAARLRAATGSGELLARLAATSSRCWSRGRGPVTVTWSSRPGAAAGSWWSGWPSRPPTSTG